MTTGGRTRILSIDGGGIRGIIPALVLAELERRAGKPVAELFDLIAGTSTGGILACGLTIPGDGGRPRWHAEELVALYEKEGPHIFDRSLLKRITSLEGIIDERYPNRPLHDVLRRYFGDARLRNALTRVLVPAYEKSSAARRGSSAPCARTPIPPTTSRWPTSPLPPRPHRRTSSRSSCLRRVSRPTTTR
jgi:patatin-like phospholipase/acyl hydrolase